MVSHIGLLFKRSHNYFYFFNAQVVLGTEAASGKEYASKFWLFSSTTHWQQWLNSRLAKKTTYKEMHLFHVLCGHGW